MSQATQMQPSRTAKEQFDRQATHYNAQWSDWSKAVLDWLIDNADVQPTDRVLDIGTGAGFTALAFAEKAAEVEATDVSTGMLEQGRMRAKEQGISNVTFVEAPAEKQPFEDASFDIVTCRIAAHHFLSVPQFLSEASRVLKAGGCLLIADTTVPDDAPETAAWQNQVEVVRDPSHVRNYSPSEWAGMVEAAGLAIESITVGGGGITIPLADWVFKAGCTPEQEREVRRLFAEAPVGAREAFAFRGASASEYLFTWQRALLKAVKQ